MLYMQTHPRTLQRGREPDTHPRHNQVLPVHPILQLQRGGDNPNTQHGHCTTIDEKPDRAKQTSLNELYRNIIP